MYVHDFNGFRNEAAARELLGTEGHYFRLYGPEHPGSLVPESQRIIVPDDFDKLQGIAELIQKWFPGDPRAADPNRNFAALRYLSGSNVGVWNAFDPSIAVYFQGEKNGATWYMETFSPKRWINLGQYMQELQIAGSDNVEPIRRAV
jgi:hypothetical protein